MKKIEFETLAAAGAIDSVVIYEPADFESKLTYELWTYSESFKGSNVFVTAKGEPRKWASLDVLVKFIREMGYGGIITLDMRR